MAEVVEHHNQANDYVATYSSLLQDIADAHKTALHLHLHARCQSLTHDRQIRRKNTTSSGDSTHFIRFELLQLFQKTAPIQGRGKDLAFECDSGRSGEHRIVHQVARSIRTLLSSLADGKDSQPCPERSGHGFLHPGHLLLENPILDVAPPIIVTNAFGNAFGSLQMEHAFSTQRHATLGAKPLRTLAAVHAVVIFGATHQRIS